MKKTLINKFGYRKVWQQQISTTLHADNLNLARNGECARSFPGFQECAYDFHLSMQGLFFVKLEKSGEVLQWIDECFFPFPEFHKKNGADTWREGGRKFETWTAASAASAPQKSREISSSTAAIWVADWCGGGGGAAMPLLLPVQIKGGFWVWVVLLCPAIAAATTLSLSVEDDMHRSVLLCIEDVSSLIIIQHVRSVLQITQEC